MNLFELTLKGGWVMIPIALCSILIVAIGVARYLNISRARRELRSFADEWDLRRVDPEGFSSSARLASPFVGRLAELYRLERNGGVVRLAELESAARQELHQLESGLGLMATIAAAAPLLGFLGTVTGMVRAFMQIQNLGGAVNASVLAGGIWEALITTVAGLVVGIPALLVYNYLASLTRDAAAQMERIGAIFVRQLGGE